MTSSPEKIVNEILEKLQSGQRDSSRKIFSLINDLVGIQEIPLDLLRSYLKVSYNLMITLDSARKACILRGLRYLLKINESIRILTEEDFEWLIIISLEKEGESDEKSQAMKLIRKIRLVLTGIESSLNNSSSMNPTSLNTPTNSNSSSLNNNYLSTNSSTLPNSTPFDISNFPQSLARSLVAVANNVDDCMRKFCIEELRELALVNPSLVASVQGFSLLMDQITDPISQEIADSITHSFLCLLNDPHSRKVVAPYIDLRSIIAPFADLDSDSKKLRTMCASATSAVLILMKTWIGILTLTSDTSALPLLTKILMDEKVSEENHSIIIDMFESILQPVAVSPSEFNIRSRRFEYALSEFVRDNSNLDQMKISKNFDEINSLKLPGNNRTHRAFSDTTYLLNYEYDDELYEDDYSRLSSSSSSTTSNMMSNQDDQVKSSPSKFSTFRSSITSFSRSISNSNLASLEESKANHSPHTSRTFSISSFLGKGPNRNSVLITPTKTIPQPKGITTSTRISGSSSNNLNQHEGSEIDIGGKTSNSSLFNLSSSQPFQIKIPPGTPFERNDIDPIYNQMDSYAALLCCSMIHIKLLQSLVKLGIDSPSQIVAEKARKLFVSVVQIFSCVLSESVCGDLLINPLLVRLAAQVGKSSDDISVTNRASQILIDLSNAFSTLPYRQEINFGLSYEYSKTTKSISDISIPSNTPKYRQSYTSRSNVNIITQMAQAYKSNLYNLNVNNIYELIEEVKLSTSFSSNTSIPPTNTVATTFRFGLGSSNPTINSSPLPLPALSQSMLNSPSVLTSDILSNIRNTINPNIDRLQFNKYIDQTRVKDGKEPFKWDWIVISETLQFHFSITQFPSPHSISLNASILDSLIVDLLRNTKWIKRISGFYRCSVEEKGYFANLDWEPTHLQYLDSAVNLYSALLRSEAGVSFLTTDRRGMLFNDMSKELSNLCNIASNNLLERKKRMDQVSIPTKSNKLFYIPLPASINNDNNNNNLYGYSQLKNVFRPSSCSYTMSREYFTLLGKILGSDFYQVILNHFSSLKHNKSGSNSSVASNTNLNSSFSKEFYYYGTPNSRRVIESSVIFKHLSNIGNISEGLNYICRIIMTSLAFTDAGVMSRHLIQLWTTSSTCSFSLKNYFYELLRVLICKISCHYHVYSWAIDVVMSQLENEMIEEDEIDDDFSLVFSEENDDEERLQNSTLGYALDEILQNKSLLKLIIAKRPNYASIPKSSLIRFLSVTEGIDYIQSRGKLDSLLYDWEKKKSIDYVKTIEFSMNSVLFKKKISGAKPNGTVRSSLVDLPYLISPIPYVTPESQGKVRNSRFYQHETPSSFPGGLPFESINPNYHLNTDIQGLFQVPWNIEVVISSFGASDTKSKEYLRVDSYLDSSDLPSALCFQTTSEHTKLVRVRGIIVDSDGLPCPKTISQLNIIQSTLTAGIFPVYKNGTVYNSSDSRFAQRKGIYSVGRDAMGPGAGIGTGIAYRENSFSNTPVFSSSNSQTSYFGKTQQPTNVNNPSITSNQTQDSTSNIPVSFGLEDLFEWTLCRGLHRSTTSSNQQSFVFIPELEPSYVYISIPGEPTVFVFRKGQNNLLFLSEVQYYIRLETTQATFVPIPRNLFGELAKTYQGCNILNTVETSINLPSPINSNGNSIACNLLKRAHYYYDLLISPKKQVSPTKLQNKIIYSLVDSMNSIELRAVLWSLGHICASNYGITMILSIEPDFIKWCISSLRKCPYFNIRSTFFNVIGLIGCSEYGSKKLDEYDWESASSLGTISSAVSLPRDTETIFTFETDNLFNSRKKSVFTSIFNQVNPKYEIFNSSLGPIENEVLVLISKIPGTLASKECRIKLIILRKEHPSVFSSRELFLEVLQLLDSYTFKLETRREVINLFSNEAKMKKNISSDVEISHGQPTLTSNPSFIILESVKEEQECCLEDHESLISSDNSSLFHIHSSEITTL